uniref:Uncharacterized protein n=1 Tax=Ascaris lumbricoides TaxID=6252 RepID=A0A0M3HTX1_ASCLU
MIYQQRKLLPSMTPLFEGRIIDGTVREVLLKLLSCDDGFLSSLCGQNGSWYGHLSAWVHTGAGGAASSDLDQCSDRSARSNVVIEGKHANEKGRKREG